MLSFGQAECRGALTLAFLLKYLNALLKACSSLKFHERSKLLTDVRLDEGYKPANQVLFPRILGKTCLREEGWEESIEGNLHLNLYGKPVSWKETIFNSNSS